MSEMMVSFLQSLDEAKGLEHLRKAFDRDPFNVRTANVLKLFEEIIPREKKYLDGGGKLVFPLPKFEIVGAGGEAKPMS